MFYVVGDLHDLLRGGSIVRLLGLPERLLVGVQHRVLNCWRASFVQGKQMSW